MGRLQPLLALLTLVGAAGCSPAEDGPLATTRSGCALRTPGKGALVVHYGALSEASPNAAFFDAIEGESETVLVTRALEPRCDTGPFALWRSRSDRHRWAFKLPDDNAAELLGDGEFVDFVVDKIDQGWDYVAIDEIGASPSAVINWKAGSDNSDNFVAAALELSDRGYGRRLMPYLAGSTISNPDRSIDVQPILATIPDHARIGMVELYRYTSDEHDLEDQRRFFHAKTRNLELAVPGINDHLIAILGVSNANDADPYRFLDDPKHDLDALTRQFAALHQEDSLTRRHPGVGAYSWSGTRHWQQYYSVYELAAHFSHLSDWYAERVGVDDPSADEPENEPLPPPLCNEPNEGLVGGVCLPSCGAAGGNTCAPDEDSTTCDGYPPLHAYDCSTCCNRPEFLPVYRSFSPSKRSHRFALSTAEAEADGYVLEGPTYSVARNPAGARLKLFQCLKSNGRWFNSIEEDCEGRGTSQGALGYIDPTPTAENRPLYRLYHSANGAHFYGASEAERDSAIGLGYKYEGVQGYVW